MSRRLSVAILLTGSLALLSSAQAAPPGPPGSQGAPFGHAAPPCFDNVNRYVDCGNGTVTDTVTGLVWLRDATCLGQADWAAANTMAATLAHGDCGLSDRSRAGDWRLATESEWASTVLRAFQLNCHGAGAFPSLTNNGGTGCLAGTPQGAGPGEHAFVNVPSGAACAVLNDQACTFWTSTTSDAFGTLAVRARLFFGTVDDSVVKTQLYGVWPVRSRP